MLNKSGYFRTPPSMIESTALDFWRKSKKPEIESYIIDHDFRKIQVKNTGSYWILPYIYGSKFYFAAIWASERTLFIITLGALYIFHVKKSSVWLGFLKIYVTEINLKLRLDSETILKVFNDRVKIGLWQLQYCN